MDISYRIKNLILKEGNISVSKFMEEVIADTQYGYYNNSQSIGGGGDFITSPEISQLFGEMIGIWCADIWYKLDCPKDIMLVELGPGKGTLMDDLLRATKNIPNFHSAMQIHLVEISNILKEQQIKILGKYNIPKFWHNSIDALPNDLAVIYIANEFFDALPINQYIKLKNEWYEIVLSIHEETKEIFFTNISVINKVKSFLDIDFKHVQNNSVIEISTKSIEIIKNISNQILDNSGAALIIDYGYTEPYAKRNSSSSTLQSIKNHKFHPVLSDIGEADISAHVDFYSLDEAAKVKGLNTKVTTQGRFLNDIGINVRADRLIKNADLVNKKNIYLALDRLTSHSKMGELFKVLSIY